MASKQPEKIPALQMQSAEESPGTHYTVSMYQYAGLNIIDLYTYLVF